MSLSDPSGHAPDYGYGTPDSYETGLPGPTTDDDESRTDRYEALVTIATYGPF